PAVREAVTISWPRPASVVCSTLPSRPVAPISRILMPRTLGGCRRAARNRVVDSDRETGPLPERFSWATERFCTLALAANPAALKCPWSPIVEQATATGRELRAPRRAFLSRRAVETHRRLGWTGAFQD